MTDEFEDMLIPGGKEPNPIPLLPKEDFDDVVFAEDESCPHCGETVSSDSTLIGTTNWVYNLGMSANTGVEAYDWMEMHECSSCGGKYGVETGNV